MIQKSKVISYIFRKNRQEILVFDHRDFPEAGTQVIGGTVEEGEEGGDLRFALTREVLEESGLALDAHLFFPIGQSTFHRTDKPEINLRNYFGFDSDKLTIQLPEKWSHEVSSSGEDNALVFHFYWLMAAQAKNVLVGNFGEFL